MEALKIDFKNKEITIYDNEWDDKPTIIKFGIFYELINENKHLKEQLDYLNKKLIDIQDTLNA